MGPESGLSVLDELGAMWTGLWESQNPAAVYNVRGRRACADENVYVVFVLAP
jgi:hypothetical protein